MSETIARNGCRAQRYFSTVFRVRLISLGRTHKSPPGGGLRRSCWEAQPNGNVGVRPNGNSSIVSLNGRDNYNGSEVSGQALAPNREWIERKTDSTRALCSRTMSLSSVKAWSRELRISWHVALIIAAGSDPAKKP